MLASVRFTMKKSCIFIAVCSNLALTLTEGKTQTTLHTTLPNFTIERILPAKKTDSYVVLTFDSLGRPVVSRELDHPRTLIDSDGDGIFESEQVFTDRVRNCFSQRINGVLMSELIDKDKIARVSGLLALQLHTGQPMKVQFRNIRVKHLNK